jgi:hypothetical protein
MKAATAGGMAGLDTRTSKLFPSLNSHHYKAEY